MICAPQGPVGEDATPVSIGLDLAELVSATTRTESIQLVPLDKGTGTLPIPAQLQRDDPKSMNGTVSWLLPPECLRITNWILEPSGSADNTTLRVERDPRTGQWEVSDAGVPVLRYNYATNEPGEVLTRVRPEDRKYARARSDYIHPLYGLDGEELTRDWSPDHPHHRGIYWAWPEVDYRGQRGDLHALQRVFARPTGHCTAQTGPVFAQLQAENLWLWEDHEPVVREQTLIRVWRAQAHGRFIDLEFQFTALNDDVAIARRESKLYGGLNVRLAPVQEQQITLRTDPKSVVPQGAWAELSGIFGKTNAVTGLTILQHPANPDYPGDWVQYPEINWFQPTFPSAETRYVLKKNQLLRLQYRLWLHAGRANERRLREAWSAYAHPPLVTPAQ